MAKLKAMLENLEELDEGLKELYIEQEVKIGQKTEKRFVLQVDGVEEHPRVKNLQTAHERQKIENRTIKQENEELKAKTEGLPEDFTVAMFEDLKTKAEGRTNNAREQLDAQKRDLETKHQKAMNDKQAELDKLTNGLRVTKIDGGLNELLAKSGVTKELMGAARAYIKEQAKIELVENDGKFEVIVKTTLGDDMPLEDFVKDWVGGEEGKVFVAKPTGGNEGGNDRPRTSTNGYNPFDRKDGKKPNQTDMQAAWTKDAVKARQMARSAGWSDNELTRIGLNVNTPAQQ
jgi:hypothetical protein